MRPDFDKVYEDSNWWAVGDESGANTFLTIPYFPFLSSCAGYGNHMSFAKLVESHPDCTLVRYMLPEQTSVCTVDPDRWHPNSTELRLGVP